MQLNNTSTGALGIDEKIMTAFFQPILQSSKAYR